MKRIAQWLFDMDCKFLHHKYVLYTWTKYSSKGYAGRKYICVNPNCNHVYEVIQL